VPLPSTQALPHITEGHEIEAFSEIKELELQHATNVADTSAGVASSRQNAGGTGSSQDARGTAHHSPLWTPSLAYVVQEQAGSGQHQDVD
jgi:hypothetical protein